MTSPGSHAEINLLQVVLTKCCLLIHPSVQTQCKSRNRIRVPCFSPLRRKIQHPASFRGGTRHLALAIQRVCAGAGNCGVTSRRSSIFRRFANRGQCSLIWWLMRVPTSLRCSPLFRLPLRTLIPQREAVINRINNQIF